jgi:hypothetical protein
MRKSTFIAIALGFTLALGACSKKPTEGGVRLQQVSDAFESAGLKIGGFAQADASRFAAQHCVAGQLEGVDTVVCEYGSPAEVAAGKQAAEAWAGNATTAAVLGNGRTVLAIADRAHVDPHGKTIHKITQAYSKTR